MKKVFYRKLIRDKIPEKMDAKGVAYSARKLSAIDFKRELLRKAAEEASSLSAFTNRTDIIAELADVAEIVAEIQRAYKITPAQLQKARREHISKKGGFSQRIFLEWTDDDYQSSDERKTAS